MKKVKWLSWVRSNEKEILTKLNDLAKQSVTVSDLAVLVLENINESKQHIESIHAGEKKADILVREIFTELNKTFITPLDREDLQRIASKIDDVIDLIDGVASRIETYEITKVPPYSLEMAKGIARATRELEGVIHELKKVKASDHMINHCRKTSEIEHEIDELYSVAIKELFKSEDVKKIIMLNDIYKTLETASDRCVDVADVVEDIVLKYT